MQFLLNLFKKPSALQLAKEEYEDSVRRALVHKSTAEYHRYMMEFHEMNASIMKNVINSSEKSNERQNHRHTDYLNNQSL